METLGPSMEGPIMVRVMQRVKHGMRPFGCSTPGQNEKILICPVVTISF